MEKAVKEEIRRPTSLVFCSRQVHSYKTVGRVHHVDVTDRQRIEYGERNIMKTLCMTNRCHSKESSPQNIFEKQLLPEQS